MTSRMRRQWRRGTYTIWVSALTISPTHGRNKLRVRFGVINPTNKEAHYNFLSTFTGTHFVTRRAYQLPVGVTL